MMADPIPSADPGTADAVPPAPPPAPTGFTTGPLMDGVDQGNAAAPTGAWDTFRFVPTLRDTAEIAGEDRYVHGEFAPRGAGGMSPSEFSAATKPIPAPMLSAQAANDQYGIEGRLNFDKPTPLPVAQMQHEATLDRIKREEIAAREPGGVWSEVKQMGVGFLGQALDPTNIALTMIPPLGEARYASWLAEAGMDGLAGRTLARVAAGATAGAVGTAALIPQQYSIAQRQQQDYGMSQVLLDIAYGAASFGAFHAAGGLVHDMIAGAPARVARQPGAPAIAPDLSNEAVLAAIRRPDISAVATADAPTHQAALQTAMAQMDEGHPVEVAPFFETDAPAGTSPAETLPMRPAPAAISPGELAQAKSSIEVSLNQARDFRAAGMPDMAAQFEEKARQIRKAAGLVQPSAAYPPKEGAESDRAYLKRVKDLLPNPERLADEPALYFDLSGEHVMVPIEQLESNKTAAMNEKGAANAGKFMAAAADGVVGKRAPINGTIGKDGKITVTDGNATLTTAQRLGWKALPVKLEGSAEAKARWQAYEGRKAQAAQLAEPGKPVRFKNAKGERALAGPDMSKPGGFRLTFIDQEGPHGHTEHPTLVEAARDALKLGYKPDGMPAARNAAGEAVPPVPTSATEAPPGRQALPSQVSTPTPEASLTTREKAPSILQGPESTAGGLVLGAMDASGRKVIQASSDLKALHAQAVAMLPAANARLDDLVRDIPGADFYNVRAKEWGGANGLEVKGQTRPAQTISDYLGGRVIVDTPEALAAVVDKLRGAGRILEHEDFMGGPGKDGYRAVHVQFDLGNGMSMEIQLVPREIAAVMDDAHGVYNTVKRINRATATDAEWAKVKAASAKMQAIYDKAWKPIADRWGHAGAAEGATIPAKFIKNDTAVLPGGGEVKVRYAIVDAKDLVASQLPTFETNPKYPAELQPRDRTRSASAVQVRDIAQNMNPKLLGENPNAADGAPIVGPDGVVESGNGRVMAINAAYAEGMPTAEKYKAYLAEQGYPIDHLEQPVLVRIRDQAMSTEERAQFGRQANQRTTLAMGTAEEAKADAAALPDHVLELHRGGDVGSAGNRDFVKGFVRDVVGPNDRAAMMDKDGALTVKGRQRIEAAILAKAYDDPGILAALLEDPESNIKAIGRAITEVSPRWALMRKEAAAGEINPKVDISKDLLDAVNLVRKARDQGVKINDLVPQDDMFGGAVSPEAEAILNIFFKAPEPGKSEVPFTRPRSMDNIAKRLDKYVEEARKSSGGPGLFGGTDVVGPKEILRSAGREGQAGEQADIFGQSRRSAGAGQGDGAGSSGGPGQPDSGGGVIGEGPAASPGGGGAPLDSPGYPSQLGAALKAAAGDAMPEEKALNAVADAAAKDPITKIEEPGAGEPKPGAALPKPLADATAIAEASVKQAIEEGLLTAQERQALEAADKGIKDAQEQGKLLDAAAACLGRVA